MIALVDLAAVVLPLNRLFESYSEYKFINLVCWCGTNVGMSRSSDSNLLEFRQGAAFVPVGKGLKGPYLDNNRGIGRHGPTGRLYKPSCSLYLAA